MNIWGPPLPPELPLCSDLACDCHSLSVHVLMCPMKYWAVFLAGKQCLYKVLAHLCFSLINGGQLFSRFPAMRLLRGSRCPPTTPSNIRSFRRYGKCFRNLFSYAEQSKDTFLSLWSPKVLSSLEWEQTLRFSNAVLECSAPCFNITLIANAYLYFVPGSVLGALHALTHAILATAPWAKCCDSVCSADGNRPKEMDEFARDHRLGNGKARVSLQAAWLQELAT